MKKILLRCRVLSKWLVLLIDMFIVGWSFFFSFFIIKPLEFENILHGHFLTYLTFYGLLSFVVYFLMGIHTGIIRYSNITDIYKIFSALFLTSLLFGILSLFEFLPFYRLTPVLRTILFVNFSIACTILIMFRISVKCLFTYVQNSQIHNKEVLLIYGSDNSSILIKQALECSNSGRFKVAGFIDDSRHKVSKFIEQKEVFNLKDLPNLKNRLKINKLVIMNDNLQSEAKRVTIEKCMELGIKVVTLPPSDDWLDGKLSIKELKDLKIEDLLYREPIQIQTHHILKQVSNKTILITGAAGSIGSEIVRQVISFRPKQVILCDQAESPLHELQLEIEEKFPEQETCIFIANIQNISRMRQLFIEAEPQLVFHAAAYKHVPMMERNPSEAISTNVLGTKILADLSVKFNVEKFIMISTDKAINPTNVMGASKRIAELYIQSLHRSNYPTKFITTRFGNVLGSNGSVIPRFKSQILKGGPVTVTHPDITRYFMTIHEAVQLVMEASAIGKGGEIFIFDMGQPVKIVDLAKKMIALSGFVADKDIKIVFTGLRPGEKLYEELLNKSEHNIPTHHSKIKISKVLNNYSSNTVNLIMELITLIKMNNEYAVVKKMKEIVPEFISNNSIYQELDFQVHGLI